eukprot:SAG31_NODE_8526_length_1435_cov_2.202096_2_plen_108_part_00
MRGKIVRLVCRELQNSQLWERIAHLLRFAKNASKRPIDRRPPLEVFFFLHNHETLHMPFDGLVACIDWSLRRGQNLQEELEDVVINGQKTQCSTLLNLACSFLLIPS